MRFRIQYSLRSLLGIVALSAIACAWLRYVEDQKNLQRKSLRELEHAGVTTLRAGRNPSFLDALIPKLHEIDGIAVQGALSPDNWRKVASIPSLTRIWLLDSVDCDREMCAIVRSVIGLDEVVIRSCSGLSKSGMRRIACCKSLQHLEIFDTEVAADCVQEVCSNSELNSLRISCCQIDVEGLQHIARNKSIEWLDVAHNGITDQGLGLIAELRQLRRLNISGNDAITSAALWKLAQMENLEILEADGIELSEEVEEMLWKLPKLVSLSNGRP